ncbi:MAG: hypothetical protein ACRC41_03325 [Sarcina sp.]
MEIINNIYNECNSLGSALGFGAFEGGVIYFSIFSLIVLKGTDAIKKVLSQKKKPSKKSEAFDINVKIIK